MTELQNIQDDGNSVVMCRNVFSYLSYDYIDAVTDTSKRNLKKGSLFIIGNYDTSIKNIHEKLLNNEFFCPFDGVNKNIVFERK